MSLAPYIHAMGRGPAKARSLSQAEARDAMVQILTGKVAPEAVGALLMLMRFRGETADEIAGFTISAKNTFSEWSKVSADVDWPSYAAGRSRGLPWFLLSALLVAQAGHRVLLHGWNSHQNSAADVREAVRSLAIPVTGRPDCAKTALDRGHIAYVPLEAISPQLLSLLRLRDVLGLRSCVNTVCRMINPSDASLAVQGVFHPSYRELQQDAARLLGQRHLLVLKGGGGEFERHPAKTVSMFGLRHCVPYQDAASPLLNEHRRLADHELDLRHLKSVWLGLCQDPWADAVVTGTAALALKALTPSMSVSQAEVAARDLWFNRSERIAA
ncbi:MAG: glycosyl transferase family protein [Pseudomonadota bacterium]